MSGESHKESRPPILKEHRLRHQLGPGDRGREVGKCQLRRTRVRALGAERTVGLEPELLARLAQVFGGSRHSNSALRFHVAPAFVN